MPRAACLRRKGRAGQVGTGSPLAPTTGQHQPGQSAQWLCGGMNLVRKLPGEPELMRMNGTPLEADWLASLQERSGRGERI